MMNKKAEIIQTVNEMDEEEIEDLYEALFDTPELFDEEDSVLCASTLE